jgi:4-hydroxybenzoate polyprenyltransferase
VNVRAYLRALRPRQWTKNGVILAPLLFAKSATDPHSVVRALGAVAAFCLLASGIYVLNDWLDRDRDRLHPEKRHRPIAQGLVGRGGAFSFLALLWLLGGALSAWLGPGFAAFAGTYVVAQVLYSFWLKHVAILDVFIIALGFVLRVASGGAAIDVPVSNWLFLCTLLLAVFLGFAKRRHELSSLAEDATSHRANLSDYSVPMLDQMLSIVAAACIVAYALYTVSPQTVEHVGSDGLKYTVPCVLYGIFRYLFLIHRRNAGGSPERVLLSDAPLLLAIAVYLAIAGAVLYR